MPSVTLLADRGVRPLVFRPIPAGEFVMGSRGWHRVNDWSANEEPAHRVVVPRWLGHGPAGVGDLEGIAFWMAEAPVTQGQFDLWKTDLGAGGYCAWFRNVNDKLGLRGEHTHYFREPEQFPNRVHHPADNVAMFEALAFGEWLAQQCEVQAALRSLTLALAPESDLEFRISLPSEALWEYACRAGTDTEYWSGDGEAALAEAGWYGEPWNTGSTHPVAQKHANSWGLFELHGNVWEWCLDLWDSGAYKKRSPGAPSVVPKHVDWTIARPSPRVVRGGSWSIVPADCRSAYRSRGAPRNRGRYQGFRLCLLPVLGLPQAKPN
jgi:formylglycine-generating enzyme required for sulfatase activity